MPSQNQHIIGTGYADITFRVFGTPKGQPRPKAFSRGGHARVYDPGTAEGWKALVAVAAREHLPNAPLSMPLRVDSTWIFARPNHHYGKRGGQPYLKDSAPYWHTAKPDRDNLDKAVLDALKELGMFKDDAQVVVGLLLKRYTISPDERPGLVCHITSFF